MMLLVMVSCARVKLSPRSLLFKLQLTMKAMASSMDKRDRSWSPRRCVFHQMTIAAMEDTIRLKDDVIKRLEGRIQEKNNELVKNAYRISYLETTVKAKDEMIAMKDDRHNKVMAAMENLFKKP